MEPCITKLDLFSFFCVFFVSKGNLLGFYFTLACVECRVATVKRLPVLHHSADYISISFGIIEPTLATLKNEYLRGWRWESYAASQATLLHINK